VHQRGHALQTFVIPLRAQQVWHQTGHHQLVARFEKVAGSPVDLRVRFTLRLA
jgi:hypothetical protein